MVDVQTTTEPLPEAKQQELLLDAYMDAAELLTSTILNHFSIHPERKGVILLRYLSLIATVEGLLPFIEERESHC